MTVSDKMLRDHIHGGRTARGENHAADDSDKPRQRQVDFNKIENRHGEHGKDQHERMYHVVGKMQNRLHELEFRHLLPREHGDYLHGGLNGSLCPPELLVFKGVDVLGNFRRNGQVRHILSFPIAKLHPVREIHVFGERVVLPAAARLYCAPAEYACGAVEIHEQAVPAARGLLDHEVSVDTHCLAAGNKRRVFVKVSPAPLNKAELGTADKKGHRTLQEIDWRNKVGIENGDEFGIGKLQAVLQCPGFKTRTVGAPDNRYPMTCSRNFLTVSST